jgi:hypothetical protein
MTESHRERKYVVHKMSYRSRMKKLRRAFLPAQDMALLPFAAPFVTLKITPMRVQLHPLRPGLPDRGDPVPAGGGETA